MILALWLAAAAAGPATDALARGGSIELPPPIEAEIAPYRQCVVDQLDRSPGIRTTDSDSQRRLTASAIAACAEVRRNAIAASEASLLKKRGYRNAGKRAAAIGRTFGSLDEAALTSYLMLPRPSTKPEQALTGEQAAIVYDQCLARAAVSASRTDASDNEIYGLARQACTETRAMLTRDAAAPAEVAAILDSIDTERAASFPERRRKVREMRRAAQSQERPQN